MNSAIAFSWPVGLGMLVRSQPSCASSSRSMCAETFFAASLSNATQVSLLAKQIHRKAGAAEQTVARVGGKAHHPSRIDADKGAAPFFHAAGDEDGIDMAGVHQIDGGAIGVVERPDVEAIGLQKQDVGILAGRQRADLAFEIGAARALDGGEFEHLATGEQLRRVLLAIADALQDEQA